MSTSPDPVAAEPSRQRRARRPSTEVRYLMAEAARELFLANGYERTTTLEISRKADVSERLLFRNFGSKADLFEAAVLQPFTEFVTDYTVSWEQDTAGSTPETRIKSLVRGLYELAEDNKAILRSALAQNDDEDGTAARLIQHWAQTLQSWQEIATAVGEERGYRIDPPASIAAVAAMVFGMVLLDDLLFPAGRRAPSRKRRINAMTEMLLHGTLHSGD